jgi:hypothetical protein
MTMSNQEVVSVTSLATISVSMMVGALETVSKEGISARTLRMSEFMGGMFVLGIGAFTGARYIGLALFVVGSYFAMIEYAKWSVNNDSANAYA